ncbi:tether containing UBX domain for GLUT4 [Electrophorus electricus]|uniref:UBX domain-containing protein n=1 Tax=Electrophorus electricus TaxID=8005 RepID=A0A4W4HB91_ELEEL|nr:tether containing UBX domain for GLUT4 [Electrophorus electricus]
MAASSTTVSVLTPNGRRQTVKVSPNTPLLQVLEEVCKKHGFNPDDHGLKFQRNVLDLTMQWRFASLPNNAKLEVVPCTRQRAGAESMVRIALQLEDGSRLQGSFSSGQNLWELLDHFPQSRLSELQEPVQGPGPTPVCVYMRDEISGEEALKTTTLRSLGLTGGSAILRYVLKRSTSLGLGEPMETAATPTDVVPAGSVSQMSPQHLEMPSGTSMAANTTLPDRPSEPTPAPVPMETPSPPPQSAEAAAHASQALLVEREEAERSQEEQQVVRPKTRQAGSRGQQEPRPEPRSDEERPGPSQEHHTHLATPSNFVPFSGGGQRLGGPGEGVTAERPSSSPSSISSSPPKAKKAKASHEAQSSASSKCGARDLEEGEEYLEPVEREPLIYHLDTATRRRDNNEELTDEFFEVTVDDVRKRFAQLKSERRALEEAPLMTQALREAQMKEKMDRYPKVVLRVQFPDRRVLQGFFRPLETVAALRQFVKSHLQDPDLQFYLFIAPPKTILDNPNTTLFEASLFPAALVYFGSDVKTECYLRGSLVDSCVSALQADELIAGSIPRSSSAPSSSSFPPEHSLPGDTESAESPGNLQDPEEPGGTLEPTPTNPAKLPKWLKLPGKK